MAPKPTPPDRNTAPVAAKVRLRYAKRGRLRFASHRDFQRALERAVRRAGVPIAYSAGFSPHPKISYAPAAPTGAASEAEYVELGLTEPVEPDRVRDALDAALPPGLDVLEVVRSGPGALAERLTGSVWRLELEGVSGDRLREAVAALLAAESIPVERNTKSGRKTVDIRPHVISITVSESEPDPGESESRRAGTRAGFDECAILHVVVRHGTFAVRPDDVLAGLVRVSGLEPAAAIRATRLAQGPLDLDSGAVGDPLALDRDARTA